jgi:type I restriction enzyme S subunit
VGEIAELIQYGFTQKSTTEPVGPRYLRITDIQNGEVAWEKVPYCKIDPFEEKRFSLRTGDILFARSGATAGKTFLVTQCPRAVFASYLIRVRTFPEVLPDYLYGFLKSRLYWDQLTRRGNAQPNANAQVLRRIVFPLPPLQQQKVIVSKLNVLLPKMASARKGLLTAVESVNRSEEGVLSMAFRGNLAPQDSGNESACLLLEKMRARRLTRTQRGGSRSTVETSGGSKR